MTQMTALFHMTSLPCSWTRWCYIIYIEMTRFIPDVQLVVNLTIDGLNIGNVRIFMDSVGKYDWLVVTGT